MFRDITRRKVAEEEARQHQTELARAGRLSTLGEMASGIAHELNQPLTAISTNAQASIRLLESDSSHVDVCVDVMERIASQADRAGEIIRQLRRLVSKEPLERSQGNVNDLVNAVAVLIRPDIRRESVQLELDLAEPMPSIPLQPIQIEQVILNLARNAIESLSEKQGGERKLYIGTLNKGNKSIAVIVRDNGFGVKPELTNTLFDPFVTGKVQGMGLGLSISYGIIEAHGGKLALNGACEEGADSGVAEPLQAHRQGRLKDLQGVVCQAGIAIAQEKPAALPWRRIAQGLKGLFHLRQPGQTVLHALPFQGMCRALEKAADIVLYAQPFGGGIGDDLGVALAHHRDHEADPYESERGDRNQHMKAKLLDMVRLLAEQRLRAVVHLRSQGAQVCQRLADTAIAQAEDHRRLRRITGDPVREPA